MGEGKKREGGRDLVENFLGVEKRTEGGSGTKDTALEEGGSSGIRGGKGAGKDEVDEEGSEVEGTEEAGDGTIAILGV